MKQRKSQKLRLGKETVRNLSNNEKTHVQGGRLKFPKRLASLNTLGAYCPGGRTDVICSRPLS